MSKSTRIGTFAETLVWNYISLWYQDDRWESEGIPFKRIRSKGSRDEGDVIGPFTSIEVKNRKNVQESSFLDNAEWKGTNSGRPYWALVYKGKGMGAANVSSWHCLTTVEELLSGFQIAPQGMTPSEVIENTPEFCLDGVELPASILSPAPHREFPEFTGDYRLRFSNILARKAERRAMLWQDYRDGITQLKTLPFIISPRRNEHHELLPPGKWYAYTRLHTLVRSLEWMGVIPQDPTEYSA